MISLATIAESLRKASKVNNALQKSNAAAQRIFEILDLESEVEVTRGLSPENVKTTPLKLPPLAKSIAFENLVFMYPGTTVPALQNVSLIVPRGQSIAIVGRNGSGKTTLLALLPTILRSAGRPDSHRRHRHPRRHAEIPSRADQHRHPGQRHLPRHHRREHRLRRAARLSRSPGIPEQAADLRESKTRPAAPSPTISSWKNPAATTCCLAASAASFPAARNSALCIARAIFRQIPDPCSRRSHQPGGRRKRTPDSAGHRSI